MDVKQLSEEIEKVSLGYSGKFDIKRDSDWYILKLQEELGELIQSYLMYIGQGRAKGKTKLEIRKNFEEEVGDVFCHVLLLARHFEVDIEQIIEEKWLKWNK